MPIRQSHSQGGSRPDSRSPSGLVIFGLVVLVLLLWVLVIRAIYPGNVREYWRYLTEQRSAVDFELSALSEEWSEKELRRQFPEMQIACYATDTPGVPEERSCFADVKEFGNAPAMFIVFFMAKGQLNRVMINIPWWAHEDGFRAVVSRHGRPDASQLLPVGGQRLHGWKLDDGSAIFVNRDRALNPLKWSSIMWSSRRACRSMGCFR